MHSSIETTTYPSSDLNPVPGSLGTPSVTSTDYSQFLVIRRNGAVVGFEPGKISVAIS